jgi:diadenosine tetraphosphate (Ap4A) HIT family hydrolase
MTCTLCETKKDIVYEDDTLIIAHPGDASKGHLRVFPKAHLTRLDDVPDALFEHLFFSANYASAVLFELFQAHGTNIILTEQGDHLAIDIVERQENDGLNFLWKPKKATPEDLDKVAGKIKDKIIIGRAKKEEVIIIEEKPAGITDVQQQEQPGEPKKVNYYLKQLDRIP